MIRGKIPEFSKTDLELLSFTLDGSSITNAPSRGAYNVSVSCDKGATGTWDYDAWGVLVTAISEEKVKCTIHFETSKDKKFANYLLTNKENIERIEHEATAQTPALTDYRYVGNNPNNYVYFGCSKNCTEDNLYRIIGVIPTQSSENGEYENRVKLIKATNYEDQSAQNSSGYTASGKGYHWNSLGTNKWEESSLNNLLNSVYWNNLGEYQKYIESAKWYLGAPTNTNYITYTSNQFYKIERSNIFGESGGKIDHIANIGLMYPSDYGYTLMQNDNSIYEKAEDYKLNSWLYQLENKYYEWTISPEAIYAASNSPYMWYIGADGYAHTYIMVAAMKILGVRPTFYLKAEVQYQSGDGSISNPYRIGL